MENLTKDTAEPSLHPEIREWFVKFGTVVTLGTKVKVLPSSEYYEACYDEGTVFTVVLVYVDSFGVNIGLNDGDNENYLCEAEGYRLPHLAPATDNLKK
jgi:hypothetical protein